MAHLENPFVFGEIIDDANFVNRTDELIAKPLVGDEQAIAKVLGIPPQHAGNTSRRLRHLSFSAPTNLIWLLLSVGIIFLEVPRRCSWRVLSLTGSF